jgi:cell division septum initiation protein DivIVA
MLNESVLQVLNSNAWRAKTLVESANQGTFFTISESEFQRLLEKEQIDEGLKDLLQKAKNAASKLPGNIQQASQAVKNAAEKASLNVGSLYQKAQDQLDKIPLVGKIPQQTRNRLIMGLALSMIGSMAGAHAADGGGAHVDTGGFDPGQHSDPNAFANGQQDTSVMGQDQSVGGDQAGGAGGEIPTPNSDLQSALNSGKGKIIDQANDPHRMTGHRIDSVVQNVSDGKMSVKDAQEFLNKQPGISKTPQAQSVLQDILAKAAKVAQADGKKAPEGQVDQVAAVAPSSATTPAVNSTTPAANATGGENDLGTPSDVQNIVTKHMKASDNVDQQAWLNKAVSAVQSGKPVDGVMKILNQKFPDMGEFHSGMVRDFLQSKVSNK